MLLQAQVQAQVQREVRALATDAAAALLGARQPYLALEVGVGAWGMGFSRGGKASACMDALRLPSGCLPLHYLCPSSR